MKQSSQLRVFLLGMMGSGKSFWAEKLKKQFKTPCYDLDSLIEMMEEKTISEIFKQDGEDTFRRLETKMLKLFAEKKQFILSVGGGTPCFNDNIQWMNKTGITIWLDEPVHVLLQRLMNEKDHRPLIKNVPDEELESFLTTTRKQRIEHYRYAQHRLSADEITEATFKKIFKQHA